MELERIYEISIAVLLVSVLGVLAFSLIEGAKNETRLIPSGNLILNHSFEDFFIGTLDECDYSDGKEWCMDSLTFGNGVNTNNPVIVLGNSSQGTKSAMLNVSGTGLNFLGYVSPELSFIEPNKTYSVSLDFYTPNISVDFWLGFYNGTTPDVNFIIFNSTDVNGDVGSGTMTAINSTWNRLYFSWDNGDSNPNSNYGNNLVIGCNACDDPVGQVAYVDNFNFQRQEEAYARTESERLLLTMLETVFLLAVIVALILYARMDYLKKYLK